MDFISRVNTSLEKFAISIKYVPIKNRVYHELLIGILENLYISVHFLTLFGPNCKGNAASLSNICASASMYILF